MMMKAAVGLLVFLSSATAFVVPVPATVIASRSRPGCIQASASGDYLASTQKAVDVSQAVAEVKKLQGTSVPKAFARDPEQFKRDPKSFKRLNKPGSGKAAPRFAPAVIAMPILAALAAAYMFVQ